MPKDKLSDMDISMRKEGLQLLYQVLMVNLVFSIVSNLTFLAFSSIPFSDKFDGFILSFVTQLLLVIFLLVVTHVIKPPKIYEALLIAITLMSYVFFCIYFFYYDIAPVVIMMSLSYMLAVQSIARPSFTFTFGAIATLFSILLLLFRDDHPFDIGIGFTSALIQAIGTGLYASLRYIRLIMQYRRRIRSQIEALDYTETRANILRQASREIVWEYDIKAGIRTIENRPINEEDERLSASSDISDWVSDLHGEDQEKMLKQLMALIEGKIDYFEQEFRQISASGSATWYAARVVSLKDANGQVSHIAGSYTYIHDKKLKELKIEHLAYYDALTGLRNRASYLKNMTAFIEEGLNATATLAYIDIVDFKEFNSSLGHSAGDLLLVSIATRLSHQIDANIQIYQVTTSDFAVVDCFGNLAPESLAMSILKVFNAPFNIASKEVFITVKMGIATFPGGAVDAEGLLRNADTALYHCQKQDIGPFIIYTQEMTSKVNDRLNLNKHLRRAAEMRAFTLVYQPIMRILGDTHALYGFEALLRWQSSTLGNVPPDQFIPLAEETGLIHLIGHQVLEDSLAFHAEILKLKPNLVISINISAKQLDRPGFIEELLELVHQAMTPPQLISLEITETSFIENFQIAQTRLSYLRDKGFMISLDDFGTGYSSLNYLGQLEIDTLKIDKSFTQKINLAANDYFLIKSMVSLASDLGIAFVAEGVETPEQLQALKAIDCPLVQGYFFGKPLSQKDTIQRWFATQ